MARTFSLLVALALAPAATHALGRAVTDVTDSECTCPAGTFYGHEVPCGAEGDTYEPPSSPCEELSCEASGQWVLAITDPAPQNIDEAICNNGGGLYTAPAAGECGGDCYCNPTGIYLGEDLCGQQGGTWIPLVFHCSLNPPGYCDLP